MPTASPPVLAPAKTPRAIPDAGFGSRLSATRAFLQDQVGFVNAVTRRNPDIVRIPLLGMTLIMLNHPDYVRHVLVDEYDNYDKNNMLYRAVRPILRDGLIGVVGGEAWRQQRRRVQPAMRRPKIAAYVGNMAETTASMVEDWRRDPRTREPAGLEVGSPLSVLVVRIVTRTLFGADLGPRAEEMERKFRAANDIVSRFVRLPFPPLGFPTPSHLRLRALTRWLDRSVDSLIEQRLSSGADSEDLLSALAQAVDEETGEPMSARQLHNEIVNLLVGGYETSTHASAWMLYYIARDPQIQERVLDEVDRVLGGRRPTFEDIRELTYLRMVVDETLRMAPPGWQNMRGTIHDDELDGYPIPAGSGIYINFYTLHRHPEFWPVPERFDPERFTPDQIAARHRAAYLPFLTGPRVCVGKHFAITELMVIAAMVLQAFRLSVAAGHPVVPTPRVTLSPGPEVRLVLEPR
jgi:cytochrome P450